MSGTSLCAEMIGRIFYQLNVRNIKPVENHQARKLTLHILSVCFLCVFYVFTKIAWDIFVEAQKKRNKKMYQKIPRENIIHWLWWPQCGHVKKFRKL